MVKRVVASAPGKIILFGEHAVVYGEPAVAVAIDRRARVIVEERGDFEVRISAPDLSLEAGFDLERGFSEDSFSFFEIPQRLKNVVRAVEVSLNACNLKRGLNIEINSDIPPSAGLGSSASVAVATVAAVGKCLTGDSWESEKVSKLAFEAEKIVHGTPSGIDNTISAYGGGIIFQQGKIERLDIGAQVSIIIGDTKVERSTKKLVSHVRSICEKYPSIGLPIIRLIGSLTLEGIESLKMGDFEGLGELMDINQGLLDAVGVSHLSLSKMIFAAREAGAYGAKLSGAGGGGCMIALTSPENAKNVLEAIEMSGGRAVPAAFSMRGVTVESEE